jgi:hypothetical protein
MAGMPRAECQVPRGVLGAKCALTLTAFRPTQRLVLRHTPGALSYARLS